MIEEEDQMKIIHVWPLLISMTRYMAVNSSNYFEFARLYNSQWTHQWLVYPDFYDRNNLFVYPVFKNFQMPNHNSWVFSTIRLIIIYEQDWGNIKCPLVFKSSHLRNRFWCIYPSFDCQEWWWNENQSRVPKSNMTANSCQIFAFDSFYKPQRIRYLLVLWFLMIEISFMDSQSSENAGPV